MRQPTAESRRELFGWYLYDWGNSAFSTTVVAVVLGPYLTGLTRAEADALGLVHPLGLPIHAGAFYPYLISLAVVLQLLTLPLVGALADASGRKKQLLALFAYLGAAATVAMYFVTEGGYLLGGLLFLIANTSFGASIVVYNAFLPEIARPERRDAVSSNGWALGYLGGGILLGLDLLLLGQASALGLSTSQAARICLASAGLWWGGFTLAPLLWLRNRAPPRERRTVRPGAGLGQLAQTLRQAGRYPQTFLFLLAYLVYNDGVETVIALSSQFGQEELGLSLSTLASLLLLVQFVGFLGALLFRLIAGRLGAKRTVALSLLIWTGALLYAYGPLQTVQQYFGLGIAIALVLGGTQALSRSLFSLLIPPGREAQYFSLYELSDKGTSWLGPLVFGLTLQFSDNYRLSLLSLAVFFLLGLALLLRVDLARGAQDAAAAEAAPATG